MMKSERNNNGRPVRGSLTVRVGVIRDGTPGISLSIDGHVIGEWTDSRARSLSLAGDLRAQILGADDSRLYFFSVPGKTISGEQLSATEVSILFEMET